MTRFYVTGWSARFGCWMCEALEAKSLESAKQKFCAKHPALRRIKGYALRG